MNEKKSLGIIAEYNPFHNGHLYHIEESVKMTGAEVVVAAMSGNFVQRGNMPIADTWDRAEAAVKNGVDLVVEIPTVFACNSAPYFANAAVKIELEKKKALDIPIVVYDRQTQTIYHESNDGTRVEIGKKMRKERYSERIAKKA